MAQVLYRKYRSKKLSEIVGQDHITRTLGEAIKSGRISHAYLFTGPRGVGKTSVARILAHEVNGLEYSDDSQHIDIIEIDAASNRRIDEIRDLREKVHTMPSSAKYKVYIIDEVHMLTKEAFNALLKTLEEPPAHVIFILATTDPHKLPDTIISRTQRYSFKPIDPANATEHLGQIAKQEKIKISKEALELIAEHGDGSFRDSISLLDQLGGSNKEVTEDGVRELIGLPPKAAISHLIDLLDDQATSYNQLSKDLKDLFDQGFSPELLAKKIMNELRDRLINDQLSMPKDKAITALKDLLNVNSSNDPGSLLLLTLLNCLNLSTGERSKPKTTELKAEVKAKPTIIEKPKKTSSKKDHKPLDKETWTEVLNELKNKYNTLYGIVRMAQPVFKDNDELDLVFDFAFHKKRVAEAKNNNILNNVISDITGKGIHINCLLNEAGPTPVDDNNPTSDPKEKDLEAISKVFGGGEVVD